MPKYPISDNALADSVLNSRTSRRLLEEKAPVNDFGKQFPVKQDALVAYIWAWLYVSVKFLCMMDMREV